MNDTTKLVREMDTILLRVPDGMKDRVAQRARANGRSMSAEIVAILTGVLDAPDEMGLRELEQISRQLYQEEQSLKASLDAVQSRLSAVYSELYQKRAAARRKAP